MRDPRRLLILAIVALSWPRAQAQDQYSLNQYEQQYGTPVEVALSDLVQSGSAYEGRAIRTKGQLEFESAQGGRQYALRDNFGSRILLVPVREVAAHWDDEAMKMTGKEVEVTGLFRSGSQQGGVTTISGAIQFWKYLGPPEEDEKAVTAAPTLPLESLVTHPDKQEGRLVRVVGQFRGRNLFGDLPGSSERSRSDWVIKDDVFAVWVTGKKPKGTGWELDSSLKRDTGHWIEVIGRVEAHGPIVYLRAVRVMQGAAPKPSALAQAPTPPPERPLAPPVVVFALPLDGEADIPRQSRFVVQFSKDMDEATFKGRVVLRYPGRTMPGDRELDAVAATYDGGRRALTVDPGDLLRPGRQIELLLLPGIADVDGIPLEPRPGHEAGVAVDMLRYKIGS
jgi:Big-like domain-containing protein